MKRALMWVLLWVALTAGVAACIHRRPAPALSPVVEETYCDDPVCTLHHT